jgi:aspartyl/asparaginyl beta-hydroxylase (cupin superfamily)
MNTSNEIRAVLIVDVRRPMPPSADLVNSFILNVVGKRAYGRAVARKADQFSRVHFS